MPRTLRAVPLLLPSDVDLMIIRMRRAADEILTCLRQMPSLPVSNGRIESVSPGGVESAKIEAEQTLAHKRFVKAAQMRRYRARKVKR